MKIGKLPEPMLIRSVLKEVEHRREEVLVGPAVGQDCAVVELTEGEVFVLSSDPITGTTKDIGRHSVMEVMGGHTEITQVVKQPLISLTGVGKMKKENILTTASVKPGQDILITKWIGLEGTSVAAKEKEEELLKKFAPSFVETAKNFDQYLSVIPEAKIAREWSISAMHDITEGGVFGALWEMGSGSGVGLDIDLKKIPIRQETVEVCEALGLNPYILMSSGSMMIAADDGYGLAEKLKQSGIPASVVGKATEGNDRILRNGEDTRYLDKPQSDELYKIYQ